MTPSPDGRLLTDIGWSIGDGASVVDVATGDETHIPGQIREGNGFADGRSIFSPDGSRVAFAYWTPTNWEIRSIGLDGSDLQVHLEYPPAQDEESNHDDYAEVADWSADGRFLLVIGYPADGDPHLATDPRGAPDTNTQYKGQ